jgi:16S rRNA processing protein RimM
LRVSATSQQSPERRVLIGRVVGVFGVRGELKLESYTEPTGALLRYQPWIFIHNAVESPLTGVKGRDNSRGVVATVPGITDRDAAQALVGGEIWVARAALPKSKPGEYYWVDLEGLQVETTGGIDLGHVSHLFATGSNDVLVVRGERERMIPFVLDQYVISIDLDAGRMVVDWDPEF